LCCIADHCLSILSFFSFGHCAVVLITICLFCPLFLWPLCRIADHCLSILSFYTFGHCAVVLITVCLFCPFSSCIVCFFSIYGFWLTLWYLQSFLCNTIIAHYFL
jgi:hypothetical protein